MDSKAFKVGIPRSGGFVKMLWAVPFAVREAPVARCGSVSKDVEYPNTPKIVIKDWGKNDDNPLIQQLSLKILSDELELPHHLNSFDSYKSTVVPGYNWDKLQLYMAVSHMPRCQWRTLGTSSYRRWTSRPALHGRPPVAVDSMCLSSLCEHAKETHMQVSRQICHI